MSNYEGLVWGEEEIEEEREERKSKKEIRKELLGEISIYVFNLFLTSSVENKVYRYEVYIAEFDEKSAYKQIESIIKEDEMFHGFKYKIQLRAVNKNLNLYISGVKNEKSKK